MYNKRENITEIRKTIHGVEWYRERIVEMVGQIEDVWIVKSIYDFTIGMIKEGN